MKKKLLENIDIRAKYNVSPSAFTFCITSQKMVKWYKKLETFWTNFPNDSPSLWIKFQEKSARNCDGKKCHSKMKKNVSFVYIFRVIWIKWQKKTLAFYLSRFCMHIKIINMHILFSNSEFFLEAKIFCAEEKQIFFLSLSRLSIKPIFLGLRCIHKNGQ